MDLVDKSLSLCKSTFGLDSFRPLQRDVLEMVFSKRDSLLILPTGGGKSLCYQLPSLTLGGVTLVISPLISLMKDQVDSLVQTGVAATYINSSLSPLEQAERFRDVADLKYRLMYVAPERLEAQPFLDLVTSLTADGKLDLIAVDEAHCISQWGHDFRPSYRKIAGLRGRCVGVPLLALTATATMKVKADIVTYLRLRNGKIFVGPFDRANLTYSVLSVPSKRQFLANWLNERRESSGIIYCATRKTVDKVFDALHDAGFSVGRYHAGLGDQVRCDVQDSFVKDRTKVVVATNAFGMGIDKPDVRFVIHHDMPGTVESYTQEAGRAGRDGESSDCVLLYDYGDIMTQRFFLDGNNPQVDLFRDVADLLGDSVMTADGLRELLPKGTSGMMVNTCLHMMDAWGVVKRSATGAYAMRDRTFVLPIGEIEEKRRRAEMKLKCLVEYCETQTCKRNYLQTYFGFDLVDCGKCSSCLRPADSGDLVDVTSVARPVLEGVMRWIRPFGVATTSEILRGSDTKMTRKWNCSGWTGFGCTADLALEEIAGLLRRLVRSGYLERTGDEYPVLTVTESGRRAVMDNEAIHLIREEKAAKTALDIVDLEVDAELFDLLRQWRRKTADRMDVPSFMVLGDRVLKALATSYPQTDDQLLLVPGIGQFKADRYGQELLEILMPYCTNKGLIFRKVRHGRRRDQMGSTDGGGRHVTRDRTDRTGRKTDKRDTRLVTLELLEKGLSPNDIAKERRLNLSTIETHMAELVLTGRLGDIGRYVDDGRRQRVLRAIREVGDGALSPIKELVGEDISYGQIRMVVSEWRVKRSGAE